jgi:hypothetical protein
VVDLTSGVVRVTEMPASPPMYDVVSTQISETATRPVCVSQ